MNKSQKTCPILGVMRAEKQYQRLMINLAEF